MLYWMIRTVLKAKNENISIKVPKDYVGKQVEIIVFLIDEAKTSMTISDKTLSHFASESVLAEDWLTVEEDKAWRDL
jgi:hypothetical protein